MDASIAWISFAPVKGTRLRQREEVRLTEDGVPGDRAFFLVGEDGALVNGKRVGPLTTVVADHDPEAGTLALDFPGGGRTAGAVELGEPEQVRFHGLALRARPVRGDFSAALSEHCGTPLRLFAAPPERTAVDRGRIGAVTLLSLGSLDALRAGAGASEPIDPRRFRMTFGVDGVDGYAEDGWVGHDLRVGEALLRVDGNVGRCAVTTRNPDTGVADLRTLHHLQAQRGGVATTEPLPFGVHARVLEPGRVRLGDAIEIDG